MAVYLVTWELNREKSSYAAARTAFIANLERFENTKDSGLDSVRFISTPRSADQVSQDLRTKLDDNDKIVVTRLTSGTHQGWLTKAVWDWINARMNS